MRRRRRKKKVDALLLSHLTPSIKIVASSPAYFYSFCDTPLLILFLYFIIYCYVVAVRPVLLPVATVAISALAKPSTQSTATPSVSAPSASSMPLSNAETTQKPTREGKSSSMIFDPVRQRWVAVGEQRQGDADIESAFEKIMGKEERERREKDGEREEREERRAREMSGERKEEGKRKERNG
jgi:hypothetical protein